MALARPIARAMARPMGKALAGLGGDPIRRLFRPAGRTGWRYPLTLDTLFQDAAGTTPVTAPGDPVGMSLDTSKGLALGADTVVNGGFGSDTAWTKETGWAIADGVASIAGGGASVRVYQSFAARAGAYYKVTYTAISHSGTGFSVFTGTSGPPTSAGVFRNAPGTFTEYVVATGSTLFIGVGTRGVGPTSLSIDNISVRELPGNHRTQSTALNRLTYGIQPSTGIRNLLTRTEEFDNAAWGTSAATISANTTVAPDGTTTAETLTPTAALAVHFAVNAITNPASFSASAATFSVYVKPNGYSIFGIREQNSTGAQAAFDLSGSGSAFAVTKGSAASNTATITEIGDGWYRCTMSVTAGASYQTFRMFVLDPSYSSGVMNTATWTANGTSGVFIWGAQLELGTTATAYQRVGNAFDVTEAGVSSIPYLSYNGSNSSMATASFAWGSDKATICVGVRKNSDAARGMLLEFSTGLVAGSFYIQAPTAAAANTYEYVSIGTGARQVVASSLVAPITNVLTGISDIGGDLVTLRVNGAQVGQNVFDQGPGNYGTYQLFWGARGGISLHANVREYPSIGINAALTASELASVEAWVTARTGTLG